MSFLGRSVWSDLNELRSAKNDAVQWTLSQVEIEFLDFNIALRDAVDAPTPDLALLRKEFDVLFSRHDIISNGQAFAGARGQQQFWDADHALGTFLQSSIPMIDADDTTLTAALPALSAEAEKLRPIVRRLYASGLSHFATASDTLRDRLFTTLLQLTLTTLAMLISLAALSVYSRLAAKKMSQQRSALRQANTHMQTILSTTVDSIIVCDTLGRVVDFNAAAEQCFGYQLTDIKGQSIGELIVPKEHRDAHDAGLLRMRQGGEANLIGKERVRLEACRSDGSAFPIELALQAAEGENGPLIIAFLRDISKQIAIEAELRDARDLALAGEKAKAEFLTIMSHEIRTPLTGLLGNLSLLSATNLDANQSQFTDNMDISGRQLMKHVNAILNIARFESGRMSVKKDVYHLDALLQSIVDGQSANAKTRSNQLSWAWQGQALDWVEGDAEHLEQILLNLIGNAIKFTKDGSVTLQVDAQETKQGDASHMVMLRVTDTGTGIETRDLKRIFDDFETAKASGEHIDSTGLGLGIAKRLTSLLGGEIGVESELSKGSSFWVRLPMTERPKPKDSPKPKAAQPEVQSLKILLAEDNEMNAYVVQKLLEREGHIVTIASDGRAAVETAQDAAFDVILMDINMPELNGLQATQHIRNSGNRNSKAPIFAFSANVLPADTKRFREGGMDGFISKPVQIEELRRALASLTTTSDQADAPKPTSPKPMQAKDTKMLAGEKYDGFLSRFHEESDELMAWLTPERPLPEIAARCHKASASAALFDAPDFHAALKALEHAAEDGLTDDIAALIDTAQSRWKTLRQQSAAAAE